MGPVKNGNVEVVWSKPSVFLRVGEEVCVGAGPEEV